MPNLTSEVANSARSAATQMSQAEARPIPPPSAAPCTLAIVGLLISASVRSMPARRIASAKFSSSPASPAAFIQFRSAPAEKLLPRPPSTTTRTSGSPSSWRHAAVRSPISCALKALCTSGRFIQIVANPPVRSISSVPYIFDLLRHILNRPNFVGRIGAFSVAERLRPSVRRACAGSITPSSHMRAVA